MFEQESIIYRDYIAGLPPYLAAFAEPQCYDRYTPENQAVWRFIMRQLTHFLKTRAPEAYEQGLKRSAIGVESIPRIEEMVDSLREIGWGAICVNGFIPPAAFMEYNANKILPISADMRTLKHLLYTPAPDIVHEAAGHAPIVADPEYTDFLQKVGEYGAKALSNKYDQRVYENIRKLSIVKEYPRSTEEEIRQATEGLEQAITERAKYPKSEASMMSRFHWWTVEYGLLKRPEDRMRIYGAGLLSSLGEGCNCLVNDKVEKIKLSIDCVEVDYDITTPQPQLFYVESSKDLFPVLEELADRMAFRVGGTESLERAIECECMATVVYNTGIQMSGVWNKCLKDEKGQAFYIGTKGPTSLSYQDVELEGHGESYHSHGFSSPVGRLRGHTHSLAEMDYQQLESIGIVKGQKCRLEFVSGVIVEGVLQEIMSRNGLTILMSFVACQVRGPQGEVLFQPEWGVYDMAVGDSLPSVRGGPADKRNYDFINQKSDYQNLNIDYTEKERKIFELYRSIRKIRERQEKYCELDELQRLYCSIKELAPDNWLLFSELAEILKRDESVHPGEQKFCELEQALMDDLKGLQKGNREEGHLIRLGLDLIQYEHSS